MFDLRGRAAARAWSNRHRKVVVVACRRSDASSSSRICGWVFVPRSNRTDQTNSMKIPRMRGQLPKQRALIAQTSGNQMHDLAGTLERAINREQVGTQQLLALTLSQVPPYNHIDHAGLI